MQLNDHVAIVTACASLRGIGWATAKRFADEGARVSDQSAYITGVVLDVSGGMHMHMH